MILRLQTEEELAALQQKLKAKLPSRIHVSELRESTGTDKGRDAKWYEQWGRAFPKSQLNAAMKGGTHDANATSSQSGNRRFNAVTGVASVKTRPRKPHKGPRATFEHKLLSRQLTQAQIPFQEEFRFEPKRRWKADFMIPGVGWDVWGSKGYWLVEIVGGLWMKRGGHSQGQAQLDDMEKFNHAAKLGYRVLQFSPDQVKSGEAIGFIEQVLA